MISRVNRARNRSLIFRFSTAEPGKRFSDTSSGKKRGDDDIGAIWDSIKREVNSNESIGDAISAMRAQAAKAAKLAEDPAIAKLSNGTSSRINGLFHRFRSVFSSAFNSAKQKFESTIEANVSPKFGASMDKATNSIRERFSILSKPFKKGQDMGQLLDEITGGLFSSGRQKAYSRRAKNLTADKAEMATSDCREVVNVKAKESAWNQRIREMREKVESTDIYKKIGSKMRVIKTQAMNTETYRKGVQVHERVNDKIDDVRDVYETTQNPLIWTVRDGADHMFGESDEAAAIAAIRRSDPQFALPDFIEEMQHFMIPAVVKAFLRGDMEVLRQACGGDAMVFMNASVRQRLAQNIHFDERILDISRVSFHSAAILETGDPVIVMTFMCQHVHCHRGPPPESRIVEGSDRDIRSTFYSWAVTRDHTNDEFNWRILDISIQGIRALI